ncbi:MAG: hypothetical protein LBR52_01095 [Prevotellaceae bacterium]|jgi:RNA polymerase sigma-70 factor (ECF subfamily)|nr:hypothetical protein [Prevotellaceae bacterium]
MNKIFKYIDDFVDEYRIPFTMYISGFKHHEIAEEMDIPVGTVKSRIFFVRKKLQEALAVE